MPAAFYTVRYTVTVTYRGPLPFILLGSLPGGDSTTALRSVLPMPIPAVLITGGVLPLPF